MKGEHSDVERALERRSKELLEASVADLDAGARSRLAAARVRALDVAAERRQGRLAVAWLLPAGVAATVVLALWIASQAPPSGPEPAEQLVALGELDILLELDLLDDLEFYDWLEDQSEVLANGEGAG